MGSMLSSVVPESDIEGYHILHVHENSPAQKAGVEAFFDFIVALSGIVLIGNHEIFLDLLKKNKNKQIDLKVYSVRTNTFRHVPITPNTDWGGEGLLGLTINFCSVKEAFNDVHRVLEVYPHSPAEFAGLRSFSDYIYGAESSPESEHLDLMTIIKGFDGKEIKIFVYNIDKDACHSVMIKPDSLWGGEGLLGCGIGTGYLHRIPTPMYSKQSNRHNMTYDNSIVHGEHSVKSYNLNYDQQPTAAFHEDLPADTSTCTINIEEETVEDNTEKYSSPTAPKILTVREETIA